LVPGADAVLVAEGDTDGCVMRVPAWPGVVRDPGMCGRSLRGNREISSVAVALTVRIGKARSRSR